MVRQKFKSQFGIKLFSRRKAIFFKCFIMGTIFKQLFHFLLKTLEQKCTCDKIITVSVQIKFKQMGKKQRMEN